jgi:2-haloacid dehalogenase
MSHKVINACVFDAYGTLFDVHSAVAEHATAVGPEAGRLSQLWRQKQLEYSWVRSLMRRHADFWRVTEDALDFAMASHGIADQALKKRLMESYLTIRPYPEVPAVLRQLKAAGIRLAILSNGSPRMLDAAVGSAGIAGFLDAVLSVEEIGVYKPDPLVYRLAAERLGVAADAISFQSSNAWDAAGAAAQGLHVVWVNRAKQPCEYEWAWRVREIASLDELFKTLPAA